MIASLLEPFCGTPRRPQKGPKWEGIIDLGWPFFGSYVPKALKTDFEPIWGPSWAQLGPILGPSWGHLGPSWALLGPLGASWGHPGVCWGHLGTIFGPLWSVFGPSRGHLGPNLGPSWAQLGPTWVQLGTSWGHGRLLGAVCGPLWNSTDIKTKSAKTFGKTNVFVNVWSACLP